MAGGSNLQVSQKAGQRSEAHETKESGNGSVHFFPFSVRQRSATVELHPGVFSKVYELDPTPQQIANGVRGIIAHEVRSNDSCTRSYFFVGQRCRLLGYHSCTKDGVNGRSRVTIDVTRQPSARLEILLQSHLKALETNS